MEKKEDFLIEGNISETDEGWWNSVLEDEEKSMIVPDGLAMESSDTPTQEQDSWTYIEKVFQKDEIIPVTVYGLNRGGLLVQDSHVQGFIPLSHLSNIPRDENEEKRKEFFAECIGKIIDVKVIECVKDEGRIVFSERAALAGKGKRTQLLQALKAGGIVEAKVTNITDFGIFADLGGVEGLIHVSELSWGRVQKPHEILKIGDSIKVLILQINTENSRIALSLKRLQPNPWENLGNRFHPGDVLPAEITSITKYGIFAKLEIGVEGLIHISSIRINAGQEIGEIFHVGQRLNVSIVHLDVERRRLGLDLVGTNG